MPKIVIQNLHNKVIFEKDDTMTLLEIIHQNQVDWMFACGGKGRCTTCRAIVTDGWNNFSPETETEIKFRNIDKLKPNERLACQCSIHGDVRIKVAEGNKFMHLHYSD